MKQVLLAAFCFGLCFQVTSQEINLTYPHASIADSLKRDANTVIRLDEAVLNVLSASKYNFKVHQVFTILNAEGSYRLRHRLYFDKFRTINNVTARVYNESGILSKKYSKKDYSSFAAFDGISLATDDKVMELNMIAPSYPCTIELEYEETINGYIDLPDWYVDTYKTSTETFRYTVIVPQELDIRQRPVNFNVQASIELENNKKRYSWEAKNICARPIQENTVAAGYFFPRIEVAPNYFEYDGYPGNFSSWTSYGRWNYALYEEKNPFSENRKKEIEALVSGLNSTKEKIKVLYDYLKSNMRYVSLQFGIGGFKPFPVKYVDEKKYGDCKALTNYMRYLLDAAGIKSYPVLINAGYNAVPVDPSFPKTTFNHVILCVPDKTDTTWLECTSNDNEMGFLGSFTENKTALLLNENGGVLVKTPASKYENNLLSTYNEIFLNEEGGAKTTSRFYVTGDVAGEIRQLERMDAGTMKEALINYMNYKPADLFSTSGYKDSSHGHSFLINLEFDKLYAFKAGNKFFFPQKLNKNFHEALKEEKRVADYLFEYPYQKTDTTIIYLPQNFTSEELPAQTEIKNDFAFYKNEVISDTSGKIKIVTTLFLKKHVIPALKYKEVYDFFAKVAEYEEQNIVLKKL